MVLVCIRHPPLVSFSGCNLDPVIFHHELFTPLIKTIRGYSYIVFAHYCLSCRNTLFMKKTCGRGQESSNGRTRGQVTPGQEGLHGTISKHRVLHTTGVRKWCRQLSSSRMSGLGQNLFAGKRHPDPSTHLPILHGKIKIPTGNINQQ